MPKISDMSAPAALSGIELLPGLQGGDNRGVPLLALGNLPRGEVLKLRVPMLVDLSATADADPGAGKLRWNHATPASATVLYVDDADDAAADLSAALATLNVGGFFYVQASADSARRAVWQKWQVTSVTDASGYTKVGVSYQGGAGTFIDGEDIEVSFQQPTPSPGVDRNVVTALAISSGVVTVDCALGDYFTLALTANVTGWAFTNVPPACSIMVEITQGAGPYTVAWDADDSWAGGSAPAVSTANGAMDVLARSTFNGGADWRSTLAKEFS